MKKVILISTLFQLIISLNCLGQIMIFGVDITKHSNENVTKKYNCSPNPYFVFAEWNFNSIKFENYTAKTQTPQMKDPEKYMIELSKKLSKTLGSPVKIVDKNDTAKLMEDKFYWRFKYKNVYYFIELRMSTNHNWGHLLYITMSNKFNKDSYLEFASNEPTFYNGIYDKEELVNIQEYVVPSK